MAFASSNGETVVIRRPPRYDNYGDLLAGSASQTSVPDCLVAPGTSVEDENHSVQVVADADIYMPENNVIGAEDQLIVRGDTYEVIGKPQLWLNEGIVVSVRLVTG